MQRVVEAERSLREFALARNRRTVRRVALAEASLEAGYLVEIAGRAFLANYLALGRS